jgi:hypothetical protein
VVPPLLKEVRQLPHTQIFLFFIYIYIYIYLYIYIYRSWVLRGLKTKNGRASEGQEHFTGLD